mgnify:FL=1
MLSRVLSALLVSAIAAFFADGGWLAPTHVVHVRNFELQRPVPSSSFHPAESASPAARHGRPANPRASTRSANPRASTRSANLRASTSRPYGVLTERSAALVAASREALFSYRLQAARDSLDVLGDRPDGALAAQHGRLWVLVVEGFMTEDPAILDAFDRVAEEFGDALDDAPENVGVSNAGIPVSRWMQLMEGEMRLLEALVAGRRGEYVSAAWKARSARSTLADLEEEAPAFADPLFTLGLIRVAVATLPRTQRFVLRFLGFRGDADGGRELLETAASRSETNRYPARAVLALLDLVVRADTEAGLDRLRALYRDTPESLFSAYLLTFALTENRKLTEAEEVLVQAQSAEERPGYVRLGYLDYFEGYIRFVNNDFAAAAEKFLAYEENHAGDALRAQALLYAGLSTEMHTGWEAARPIYREVDAFRDFDSDRWADRWAEKRDERPMREAERHLLAARTAFDRGDMAAAEQYAKEVWAQPDATEDEQAEAAYRLGRVYHETGALNDAIRFYDTATQSPGEEHAKWAPYSLYYSGQILKSLGREEMARNRFERAIDWPTPYDYSDGLEQMATATLEESK